MLDSDVSEELLIFEALKFLTERIEFLVTYGCDRMLKVYFWLVPCGSTNSCTFCLICFSSNNYRLYFDDIWLMFPTRWQLLVLGKAWLICLMEQRRAMITLPLSVTYDVSWSARPILFSLARASDRLVLGILSRRSVVKLCVMIEGQRTASFAAKPDFCANFSPPLSSSRRHVR